MQFATLLRHGTPERPNMDSEGDLDVENENSHRVIYNPMPEGSFSHHFCEIFNRLNSPNC